MCYARERYDGPPELPLYKIPDPDTFQTPLRPGDRVIPHPELNPKYRSLPDELTVMSTHSGGRNQRYETLRFYETHGSYIAYKFIKKEVQEMYIAVSCQKIVDAQRDQDIIRATLDSLMSSDTFTPGLLRAESLEKLEDLIRLDLARNASGRWVTLTVGKVYQLGAPPVTCRILNP